jgi:hypothetical protein
MPAAAALPWKDILGAIPVVVSAAKTLWNFWATRPKPQPIEPGKDVRSQLVQLAERVSVLESTEAEQTKLMTQMAEQLQAVARRASIAYWLGAAGLALGLTGIFLALVR